MKENPNIRMYIPIKLITNPRVIIKDGFFLNTILSAMRVKMGIVDTIREALEEDVY